MQQIIRLTSTMLVLTLVVSACGGGSNDDSPDHGVAGVTGPDSPLLDIPELDDDSPYVRSLCDIDFLGAAEADDPLRQIIDELGDLPTSSSPESGEVQWMTERLERHIEVADPFASEDLFFVGALLRARCG